MGICVNYQGTCQERKRKEAILMLPDVTYEAQRSE